MTKMTHTPAQQTEPVEPEPMVDSRVAAVSLRLPHYWFSDPVMRDRYRIPHYQLGCLVRYRLSELYAWAATHARTCIRTQAAASRQGGEGSSA